MNPDLQSKHTTIYESQFTNNQSAKRKFRKDFQTSLMHKTSYKSNLYNFAPYPSVECHGS
jgi:hypothetical protein